MHLEGNPEVGTELKQLQLLFYIKAIDNSQPSKDFDENETYLQPKDIIEAVL